MDSRIAILLGFLFAILVGHIALKIIVDKLWDPTKWRVDKDARPYAYLPRLVGIVERSLYFFAFIANEQQFIAVWLALKVAGQWKRWEEEKTEDGKKSVGRMYYNIFLIGSGLSLAYAYAGAKIIDPLVNGNFWNDGIVIIGSLLAFSLILYLLIIWYQKKDTSAEK